MAMSHPRFRAAYDFLLVRESAGEIEPGLGKWWTDFQATDERGQERMLNELTSDAPKKRRRKRKPANRS